MIDGSTARKVKEEVLKRQPHWTRKLISKEQLFEYVNSHKAKPSPDDPWYGRLFSAFRRLSTFRSFTQKKRPHWFVNSRSAARKRILQRQARILVLAQSGGRKPTRTSGDGKYLYQVRCKASHYYDRQFCSKVEIIRPDFFFSNTDKLNIKIKQLFTLAKSGNLPLWKSPESRTLEWMKANKIRFQKDLSALKTLRPDFFINKKFAKRSIRAMAILRKMRAGRDITKQERASLLAEYKSADSFRALVQRAFPVLFRWDKSSHYKDEVLKLIKNGSKRPPSSTKLGAYIRAELSRNPSLRARIQRDSPSWLGKALHIKPGTVFGMLATIREVTSMKWGATTGRRFLCKCECGNTKVAFLGNLRSGATKSCGCLRTQKKRFLVTGLAPECASRDR